MTFWSFLSLGPYLTVTKADQDTLLNDSLTVTTLTQILSEVPEPEERLEKLNLPQLWANSHVFLISAFPTPLHLQSLHLINVHNENPLIWTELRNSSSENLHPCSLSSQLSRWVCSLHNHLLLAFLLPTFLHYHFIITLFHLFLECWCSPGFHIELSSLFMYIKSKALLYMSIFHIHIHLHLSICMWLKSTFPAQHPSWTPDPYMELPAVHPHLDAHWLLKSNIAQNKSQFFLFSYIPW